MIALAAALIAPADDFAALADRASDLIRRSYFARQSRKDEMERHLAAFVPAGKKAVDRQQFGRAMDEMIARFNDSHFDFLPDTRQGYYLFDGLARGKEAKEMPHIGAWFRPTPAGYTVQMVLEGMAAEKAGLRKGDLVRTIDSKPFSPIEALRPLVGKEAKVGWTRNGKPMEAAVEVEEQTGMAMFLSATRNSARVIEHKGKRIGYTHLWTMGADDFRNALHAQVYGRLANTDAMILDIRDGFGGRPEGFGDPFFRPDVTLEWQMGEGTPPMRQRFGYGKPLVVLINEGSRSAKEVFAHIMKQSGRATLVGSTTAGDVLGTSPLRLADWAYIEIPMVDLKVDGFRIERVGVAPHIAVPAERDDSGEDLHLKAALEFLTR